MRSIFACLVVVVSCVCVWQVAAVAGDAPSERGPDDPIFIRWLQPTDPQDQTILDYWRRYEAGQLSSNEIVDLGTMLYHRGYPKDAVRCYRAVLKVEKDLHEAWFRIGMVMHQQGEIDDARYAYTKCLKLLTGHGWCNFYLGLLEEQTGHASKALDYYRRAFKFAPELADPEINTALLYSKLQIGASLLQLDQRLFSESAPMLYLEPERVNEVRSRFEPTPTPELQPPAAAAEPATAEVGAATQARPAAPTLTPTPARTPVAAPEDSPFGVGGASDSGRPRTVRPPQPPMPTGTPDDY